MLYICLRSHQDWTTQDRLGFLAQRLGGWFSIRGDCVDYFVPQDRAYLLHLVDGELSRQLHLDYID